LQRSRTAAQQERSTAAALAALKQTNNAAQQNSRIAAQQHRNYTAQQHSRIAALKKAAQKISSKETQHRSTAAKILVITTKLHECFNKRKNTTGQENNRQCHPLQDKSRNQVHVTNEGQPKPTTLPSTFGRSTLLQWYVVACKNLIDEQIINQMDKQYQKRNKTLDNL